LRTFVFNAVVLGSVLHGAGAVPLLLQKDVQAVEIAHRRALRWLLGVSSSAVTCAVAAEVGHTSAAAIRDRRTLTFFGALLRKPDTSICRQVFAASWSLRGSRSASTWVTHVTTLLEYYGLDPTFASNKADWKRRVNTNVTAVNAGVWREECRRHLCSVVRLTANTATSPTVDNRLNSMQPAVARLVIALRCGSAGLMLERCRLRRAESHNCIMCDRGVREDLPHLLLSCAAYTVCRRTLLNSLTTDRQREWLQLTQAQTVQVLLFLPVRVTIPADVEEAVVSFLTGVWAIRSGRVERWWH